MSAIVFLVDPQLKCILYAQQEAVSNDIHPCSTRNSPTVRTTQVSILSRVNKFNVMLSPNGICTIKGERRDAATCIPTRSERSQGANALS